MNFGDPDLNEIARLGMLSGEVDQLVCLAVAAVNLIIFLGWSVDQHSHDPAPDTARYCDGHKTRSFH